MASICLRQRFQSYLYGIEIKGIGVFESRNYKFQSYLYGIEIVDIDKVLTINNLSFNRTFMELKFSCPTVKSMMRVFQSYLYGIEITFHFWFERVMQSFNRTFMELKYQRVQHG